MERETMFDIQFIDGPVAHMPLDDFPPEGGAECIFLGRTRGETHAQHGALTGLTYEAHLTLAERTLRELAEDASRRWPCLAVRVHHAVGAVPVGAASVLVQVACGHRTGAFEACRFLIDELKARAPIWKREQWESGATWVDGHVVPPGDSRSHGD